MQLNAVGDYSLVKLTRQTPLNHGSMRSIPGIDLNICSHISLYVQDRKD